ncbi:MAG TPA: hypothetical protein VM370_13735 [Candidatus Thermoplasmatota archaeon]|nr:hypothetical protein [Candidatus Thermoplasmatota archaeon]
MFAHGMIASGGWYVLFLLGGPIFAWQGIAWLVGWGLVAPILLYPSFIGTKARAPQSARAGPEEGRSCDA